MAVRVSLRAIRASDLDAFFAHQCDPEAAHQVALLRRDPTDRAAFDSHWQKILADDTVVTRAVLADHQLAGQIVRFAIDDVPEVGNWLDRKYWGKGIASEALRQFLNLVEERPLHAHTASDNLASCRVLAKNGFQILQRQSVYSPQRNQEIEESIWVLQ